MRSLAPIQHDDQKMFEAICEEKAGWSAHKDVWIQASNAYKIAGGNPWTLKPASFLPDISEELKDLYRTRRQGGHIERIRNYPFRGSCPLCGSLSTGTVDHYLPKKKFPEFSIYSLNLVPACSSCNSGEKGTIYQGKTQPERIIHPYFDKIGDKPILSVEFKPPYEAVEISAKPGPGLSGDELKIVSFHIETLLGDAFRRFVDILWSTLPQTVADSLKEPGTNLDASTTKAQVKFLLEYNQRTYGPNSWPAGFYRGMLADPSVIDFITQKATIALAENASVK